MISVKNSPRKVGKYYIPEDPYFEGIFTTGEFEPENLKAALDGCTSFRTAIDGGAHVGSWTGKIAERFNRVWAFEPCPENFACLVLNADSANVIPVNAALGEVNAKASLVKGTNSGSGYLKAGNDVRVVTLDAYGLTNVDFLKLDVEGYELFALWGAVDTIKASWPVVLVEQKKLTARYGKDYLEAGKFLESLGYRLINQVNNDFIYRK